MKKFINFLLNLIVFPNQQACNIQSLLSINLQVVKSMRGHLLLNIRDSGSSLEEKRAYFCNCNYTFYYLQDSTNK